MPQHMDYFSLIIHTVKLVYKDHDHRDQQNVVFIHGWCLYADSIAWKVYTWGPVKCGLHKQVVFIYGWSLEQVDCTYVYSSHVMFFY